MSEEKQAIRSGGNSLNVQTINNGLSLAETRTLIIDVVQAEMYRYKEQAQAAVEARAEVLAEKILRRLSSLEPDVVERMKDPDVQYVLGAAGRAFTRSGDAQLGDVLVDMLTDRLKERTRSLRAIIINDAIETVGKLTDGELAALSLNWRIYRTVWTGVRNFSSLLALLERDVVPFIDKFSTEEAAYYHMDYAGVVSVNLNPTELGAALTIAYPAVFNDGFPVDLLPPVLTHLAEDRSIFLPHESGDPHLMKLASFYGDELIRKLSRRGFPGPAAVEHAAALRELERNNTWTSDRVEGVLRGVSAPMAKLVEKWSGCLIKQSVLTSIGVAIAHSNYRHVTGMQAPLQDFLV